MQVALWNAQSGLEAQQRVLDVVADNVANLSTPAFKKARAAFAVADYMNNLGNDPTGAAALAVGPGAPPAVPSRVFLPGSLVPTGEPYDFAIVGLGYFVVQDAQGQPAYTRAGNFAIDGNYQLTDGNGHLVLGLAAPGAAPAPVTLAGIVGAPTVGTDGTITYTDAQGQVHNAGQLALVQFVNEQGLSMGADGLWHATQASGAPTAATAPATTVVQGQLEQSNVDMGEEMVSALMAERAYQISARALGVADEMIQKANELGR